jgi:DNA-binding XRE family transcriptional regulator
MPTQEAEFVEIDICSILSKKEGDLIWVSGENKPSTLGIVIKETEKKSKEVRVPKNLTKEQMAEIVARVDMRKHSYKQITAEDIMIIDELWPVEKQFEEILSQITKSDLQAI